jgi:SAM-dependent methyltransferase
VDAARDWAAALASWDIPPEIMATAPADPWAWAVARRVRATEQALTTDSPSVRRAREALPDGGSVLDVGCGAGSASLPLCPPATSVVGVDEDAEVLAAFAEQAERRGVAHHEIVARWPDGADEVAAADLVACHNVIYNVADIEPFVAALADHARRRTVIEVTSEHPRAWMSPLWRVVHGIDRPVHPNVDDAIEVLAQLGIEPLVERWIRPSPMSRDTEEELVAFVRQALCLGLDRDPDVASVLREHPPPKERELATLWWDPA